MKLRTKSDILKFLSSYTDFDCHEMSAFIKVIEMSDVGQVEFPNFHNTISWAWQTYPNIPRETDDHVEIVVRSHLTGESEYSE
jgi:hypothetical protein